MASGPITSWQIDGEKWKQWQILFSWAPESLQMVTATMKLKDACLLLGRKAMTNLDSILRSRDIAVPVKVCLVKAMVFPVVMYGCESWTINKAECWRTDAFCTVVLKTLESPLDCKEIQPVHLKGDQSWVFIGRTDVEAETPIIWPPDVKSWLIGKDPDAGKDWGQEEKGMTENEMAGWHHRLNGHGFGWTPGVGDGQGGLVCRGSRGRRVRHNWATELNWKPLAKYWLEVATADILVLFLILKYAVSCRFFV